LLEEESRLLLLEQLLLRSPFCYRALLHDSAALDALRAERLQEIEQMRMRRDQLLAWLQACTERTAAVVH
jgi:hypothetical protein